MKKHISILLIVMVCFLLSSCKISYSACNHPETDCECCLSSSSKANPPLNNPFSFYTDYYERQVRIGETVTITAYLVNPTDTSYVLQSNPELIQISIYAAGELPEYHIHWDKDSFELNAKDSITKSIDFQPTEEGIYYISAFCEFSINNIYYDDRCSLQRIVVVEAED